MRLTNRDNPFGTHQVVQSVAPPTCCCCCCCCLTAVVVVPVATGAYAHYAATTNRRSRWLPTALAGFAAPTATALAVLAGQSGAIGWGWSFLLPMAVTWAMIAVGLYTAGMSTLKWVLLSLAFTMGFVGVLAIDTLVGAVTFFMSALAELVTTPLLVWLIIWLTAREEKKWRLAQDSANPWASPYPNLGGLNPSGAPYGYPPARPEAPGEIGEGHPPPTTQPPAPWEDIHPTSPTQAPWVGSTPPTAPPPPLPPTEGGPGATPPPSDHPPPPPSGSP